MSTIASAYAEAVALFRAGDLAGAERALTPLDTRSFDAVHLLAGIKRARGEAREALALFDAAIALKPDSAAAQNNRASLLLQLGDFDKALTGYEFAISLKPDSVAAWSGRGAALDALDRTEQALACFDHALAMRPDDLSIARDRAVALTTLRRYDEAIAAFDAILSIAPDQADVRKERAAARYNKGVSLLRAGDYANGFTLYEERRAAGAVTDADLSRGKPAWRGEKLDGALHVWTEMGVGEAILFASLLPRAAERAPRTVLECDPRLVPLFARSFPFLETVPIGASIEAQAQCSVASLPHILGVARENLSGASYLKADVARVAALRVRYEAAANGRKILGIAWRSKNTVFGDEKSSRLEDWGALLREPYYFVNLQYGDVGAEIEAADAHFGCSIFSDPDIDQMHDLDGFAAQIAALDHIVSVSNTTVHMAGALGKPAIVLVPPERRVLWYWGEKGERTPWYQSLRLLAHDTDWPTHVARAATLMRTGAPP